MSGYPLLHPGLTPAQHWLDQGASLDSDEWVSTPSSWSDAWPAVVGPEGIFGLRRVGVHSSFLVPPLYRTGPTGGHLWTQTSGCPLLHPGPIACTTTSQTRGMSGLRCVGIHSSILVLPLPSTGRTRGHLWTQTSGCPLVMIRTLWVMR